jgi:hypothetical protein
MNIAKLILGFAPWIAYTVIVNWAGPASVPVAALIALAIAAALIVRTVLHGASAKILEVTGAAVFAVYAVVAFAAPATEPFLAGFGRALSTLLLAVVILATLPVRPFTEQYARESVPVSVWNTPRFHTTNRRISAAWGAGVLVMGLGHTLAGLLENPVTNLLLNWGVPIAVFVVVLGYTKRTVAAVRHEAAS